MLTTFSCFQYYEMSYGLNVEMHKQVRKISHHIGVVGLIVWSEGLGPGGSGPNLEANSRHHTYLL